MPRNDVQVLVVGGGLAGLAGARALQQNGFGPVVVERTEQPAWPPSIVELWPDTLALLDRLGVGADVRRAGRAVNSWSHRRPDGGVRTRLQSEQGPGFVAIEYSRLCDCLLATLSDERVRFETALHSLAVGDESVHVEFENGVKESFDIVVGADGLGSRTRSQLGDPGPTFCGTASMTFALPSRTRSEHAGASEIWTDAAVFRAVPAPYGPVGWLTVAIDRPTEACTLDLLSKARTDIDWLLPDVFDAATADDVWRVADYHRETARWADGRVALLGDAAHARHRLTGNGVTLALEDGIELASVLAAADGALPPCLAEYATRRRDRFSRLPRSDSSELLQAAASPLAAQQPAVRGIRASRLEAAFRDQSLCPSIDSL